MQDYYDKLPRRLHAVACIYRIDDGFRYPLYGGWGGGGGCNVVMVARTYATVSLIIDLSTPYNAGRENFIQVFPDTGCVIWGGTLVRILYCSR